MTVQMADLFIWENETWDFIGAENMCSLFHPERFGLSPKAPHTACWRGFVVTFRVTGGRLYLDELEVYCGDGVYPPINGVEAEKGGLDRIYRHIGLPLDYTGTIVVGRDRDLYASMGGFIDRSLYAVTRELRMEDGVLKESRDTSGRSDDDDVI